MTTITLEIPDHLASAINELSDQMPLIIEMGLSRYAPLSTRAYTEAVDFLAQEPSLEDLAAFRFSDEIETRISDLLEKNRAGLLSNAEEVELSRLVHLEERLQLVKTTAISKLSKV